MERIIVMWHYLGNLLTKPMLAWSLLDLASLVGLLVGSGYVVLFLSCIGRGLGGAWKEWQDRRAEDRKYNLRDLARTEVDAYKARNVGVRD